MKFIVTAFLFVVIAVAVCAEESPKQQGTESEKPVGALGDLLNGLLQSIKQIVQKITEALQNLIDSIKNLKPLGGEKGKSV